jgi:hypothetical protein
MTSVASVREIAAMIAADQAPGQAAPGA